MHQNIAPKWYLRSSSTNSMAGMPKKIGSKMLHPQNIKSDGSEWWVIIILWMTCNQTKTEEVQSDSLKVFLYVINSYWLKNWWSYGHPKRLGKKYEGSWGPVATSIRLVQFYCSLTGSDINPNIVECNNNGSLSATSKNIVPVPTVGST